MDWFVKIEACTCAQIIQKQNLVPRYVYVTSKGSLLSSEQGRSSIPQNALESSVFGFAPNEESFLQEKYQKNVLGWFKFNKFVWILALSPACFLEMCSSQAVLMWHPYWGLDQVPPELKAYTVLT